MNIFTDEGERFVIVDTTDLGGADHYGILRSYHDDPVHLMEVVTPLQEGSPTTILINGLPGSRWQIPISWLVSDQPMENVGMRDKLIQEVVHDFPQSYTSETVLKDAALILLRAAGRRTRPGHYLDRHTTTWGEIVARIMNSRRLPCGTVYARR